MEPDPGKIKNIGIIKEILKRTKEYRSMMPAHVECAKRTLNMLASLTKDYNVFFSATFFFFLSYSFFFH